MSPGRIFIVGERRKIFNEKEIIETVWNATLEDHHVQWSNTEELFVKEMLEANSNVVFLTADEFDNTRVTDADTCFYWVSCANTEFTTAAVWAFFISEKAKKHIKSGRLKILITQTLEPWPNVFTSQNESVISDALKALYHDLLKIIGGKVNVKLLIGNTFQFTPSIREEMHAKITLHYYPFWEYYSQRVFCAANNTAHNAYSAPSILEAIDGSTRDYLCLNHYPRLHRPLTIHALNITRNTRRGYITMNSVPDYDAAILKNCAKFPDTPLAKTLFGGPFGKELLLEALSNPITEPITLPESNVALNVARWNIDDYLLKNTWLSLTTEAYDASAKFNFENSLIFPTEKIFRDIYLKRPVMVVGPRGFLTEMRQLGYLTFNYFWDETYDLKSSLADRLDGVMNNLCRMSEVKQRIVKDHVLMDTILEHNRTLFATRNHSDLLFKLLMKI